MEQKTENRNTHNPLQENNLCNFNADPRICELLDHQRVLFITTKNLDYIRNTQEIAILRNHTEDLTIIGSSDNSYLKRLLHIYAKLFMIHAKDFDTAFVGFSPQLVVPFWRWKFRTKKLVIDFFISVYDTMVFDRRRFRKKSILARMCKWLDTVTLKKIDLCICDTNAHGRYFTEEFHVPAQNLRTLYLEADKSLYYPRPAHKSAKLCDKFTVLYFGSILPLQGVDIITDALKDLADDDRFYFYLIGPVTDRITAHNIEYIDWLPQNRLAEYIASADLCLAGHFNKDIAKASRTIPGKAYIYQAMGKPMVLGDNCANRELFSENMDGIYFVPMGDAAALKNKLEEIREWIDIK